MYVFEIFENSKNLDKIIKDKIIKNIFSNLC